MSALGPGCVKTSTSRECTELFSLFSSFDGDCQSCSFLIQRNRDKLSTRKSDVGVFTQAGSKADLGFTRRNVRFHLDSVAKLSLRRLAIRDSVGSMGSSAGGAPVGSGGGRCGGVVFFVFFLLGG